MTFSVNVKNGTNAGWRRVKQNPGPWRHNCTEGVERELAAYHVRCPDCKVKRDETL